MSQPAQVTLPAEPASVAAARRFVRDALQQLDAAAAVDDAQALVSELATNAVIHARTAFTVEVGQDGDRLRVCVHDGSPARPRVRRYDSDSTTGRGLRLVETLASSWGVETTGSGKTVWLELSRTGSAPAQQWDDADADDVDVELLLAAFDDDGGDGGGVRARSAA